MMLVLVSGLCLIASLVIIIIALSWGGKTEGQQVLQIITDETGRNRVVEHGPGVKERIADPLLGVALKLGKKLTPASRLSRLELRLDHAGFPVGWDLNRLIVIKTLGLLVGAAFGLLVATSLNFGMGILLMAFAGIIGFYAPDYALEKTAEKRTAQMRRSLADTVDMLNLTLAAGIGFDSALRLVATNTTGALAEEFSRVVREISIGKSRDEALRALGERTPDQDLRRFCTTCIQADRRGTPFGEILAIQSTELRIKRRQDAEERAQKVPVKILFPTMIFFLPTLMLIVMGPAIASMVAALGG